jgi:hypothetical protein
MKTIKRPVKYMSIKAVFHAARAWAAFDVPPLEIRVDAELHCKKKAALWY